MIREFSLILLGNCLLVGVAWKIYGPRIEKKFLRADEKSKGKEQQKKDGTGLRNLKIASFNGTEMTFHY